MQTQAHQLLHGIRRPTRMARVLNESENGGTPDFADKIRIMVGPSSAHPRMHYFNLHGGLALKTYMGISGPMRRRTLLADDLQAT